MSLACSRWVGIKTNWERQGHVAQSARRERFVVVTMMMVIIILMTMMMVE